MIRNRTPLRTNICIFLVLVLDVWLTLSFKIDELLLVFFYFFIFLFHNNCLLLQPTATLYLQALPVLQNGKNEI